MKINKFLLAVCTVILAFTSLAIAQTTPPEGGTPKAFNLPKTETFKLKNGMEVTFAPYGNIPKVAISAVIRSGNINEAANQIWLADLTGDLMKEGTTSRSAVEIARSASSMGGSLGLGVGMDTTTVGGDVLSEFGPQFVALLADVIQHPTFPESELARLKNNRLRQLSIAKSQPGTLASERFRQILYPNHPYGRLYPTEAMINSYTVEDIKKFYSENFGAARTHLYVVGQFDAAAMRKAITQAFENWAAGTQPQMNIPKPITSKNFALIDRPKSSQSTLYIGLPVIDPSHPDYIPFIVANALLGGSFSSRITANIRENKGYTYSPFSQHSSRYRDAYWVEIADVTTNVTGPSIKEILYEINRLRNEPPTAEETAGIKNYMAGIFVLNNSSRQGVIGQLAFADMHGLPANYLSTYVQKVSAVTPQDIQRIAKQYLDPEKLTIVVVGDKEKIEDQIKPYEVK